MVAVLEPEQHTTLSQFHTMIQSANVQQVEKNFSTTTGNG